MSSMNTKHVGKLSNTGKKCVVVFRELPEDKENCLIVDTDACPDWMHDDIMNAVILDHQAQMLGKPRVLGDDDE